MLSKLSKFLDKLSEFISQRKGLLPLFGIAFIILNFILKISTRGWLADTDMFLHVGIIISILGILLAWAL